MRGECYQCGSTGKDGLVLPSSHGVPLCPSCMPKPEPIPMPADEPLRLDGIDSELERMRRELGFQWEDDERDRTPTLRMDSTHVRWRFKDLTGVYADSEAA